MMFLKFNNFYFISLQRILHQIYARIYGEDNEIASAVLEQRVFVTYGMYKQAAQSDVEQVVRPVKLFNINSNSDQAICNFPLVAVTKALSALELTESY